MNYVSHWRIYEASGQPFQGMDKEKGHGEKAGGVDGSSKSTRQVFSSNFLSYPTSFLSSGKHLQK